MRTDFYLGPPEEYELLNKSGCIYIDGVDDAADFKENLVSDYRLLNPVQTLNLYFFEF